MGAGALVGNNSLSLDLDKGKDSDMGKFEEKRDARAISLCHVSQS